MESPHGVAMTKTENRAAAKAYQREQEAKRQEEWRAQEVAADLEACRALRKHLIFKSRTGVPREALQNAIDDYVEALTGDRRKLWAETTHAIGSGPPKL